VKSVRRDACRFLTLGRSSRTPTPLALVLTTGPRRFSLLPGSLGARARRLIDDEHLEMRHRSAFARDVKVLALTFEERDLILRALIDCSPPARRAARRSYSSSTPGAAVKGSSSGNG
jgi:hypothetical protein